MTKNIVKNVIIVVLLIVLVFLLVTTFIQNQHSEIVRYSYFDDDLIQIDNESSFKVKSNIVDNDNLLVYVSSDENHSVLAVVKVIFYDEKGKKIDEKSSNLVVLDNSGQVFTFTLPSLDDNYAGNIDIVVKQEKINHQNNIFTSDIELEESHIITDSKNTNFTIQINNNSDFLIQSFTGMIVGLKDDKIVAAASFSSDNILANSSNTTSAAFYFDMENHKIMSRDYDQLLMFPIYIEI